MNRINKPSTIACLTIAVSLALSSCGGASAPQEEPPLAGAAIGGDFALTNSKGETVRWGDFAGKYRIVYFGYTFCPDICPTDMSRVAQGLKALKASDPDKAGKIVPIFITIDPERDTQAVVGEFAAAFSPDIVGLTGTNNGKLPAGRDWFTDVALAGGDPALEFVGVALRRPPVDLVP